MATMVATTVVTGIAQAPAPAPPIARFIDAASPDSHLAKAALDEITGTWRDTYAAILIDMVRLMPGPRRAAPEPTETAMTTVWAHQRNGLSLTSPGRTNAVRRFVSACSRFSRDGPGDDSART